MTTLVPDKQHPALDVPESERAAYLAVVTLMVFADEDADERELSRVRAVGETLELAVADVDAAIDAARSDDPRIEDHLETLRGSELRYALMVDALDIAYADDEIVADEAEELRHLAEKLDISDQQLAMLRRYVEARTGHEDQAATEKANQSHAAGLAAAGIPIATLAIASTIGAPLLAGVGVAAALGVGSYTAVRWLLGRHKHSESGGDSDAGSGSATSE